MLSQHGWPVAPPAYCDAARRAPSARTVRDEQLKVLISQVHKDNYGVCGARKTWLQLNREGTPVARCTVERLMRELDLAGARRGKRVRTTVPAADAVRPADLVRRQFSPAAPDRLRVAGFTYVRTWTGMVYVAFVIDACSRRILGWRAATSMTTTLVLDALEQALRTRQRAGGGDLAGLVHHTGAGSQYTSVAFTGRLAAAGVSGSAGTAGDACDNALAEFGDRLVQDRADQATRALAHRRAGRDRHLGVRGLVQPPAALRGLRRHTACRARGCLLQSECHPRRGKSVRKLSLRTHRGGSIRSLPVACLRRGGKSHLNDG